MGPRRRLARAHSMNKEKQSVQNQKEEVISKLSEQSKSRKNKIDFPANQPRKMVLIRGRSSARYGSALPVSSRSAGGEKCGAPWTKPRRPKKEKLRCRKAKRHTEKIVRPGTTQNDTRAKRASKQPWYTSVLERQSDLEMQTCNEETE